MTMEESFPRGGVQKKEGNKRKQEGELFEYGKIKKKKKEKKNKKGGNDGKGAGDKKKQKEDDIGIGQVQPQFLSKRTLYPGMLMLGYVKQIKNYELIIALPNGLSGSVAITNISDTYTESLQKFSEGDTDNTENVSTLSELFKVGMILPCKLTEHDTLGGPNKVSQLSIKPKDVNGDVTSNSLRNGMFLYGNISSHEDHGYIVDIGVRGVHTFLKNKEAAKYIQTHNKGKPLRVGQSVLCKVQMKADKKEVSTGQKRVVDVTIDPEKMKVIDTIKGTDVAFTSLVPGMKVQATVEKIWKGDGITVEFNGVQGLIHRTHLPNPPQNYSIGQKAACSILYIHPLVKSVTLSMLPHLTDYTGAPTGLFANVQSGLTIEDATVIKTEKNQSVLFDLQNNHTGFAGVSNLSDEKIENVGKVFTKGSVHRCRVVGFYPMEALVIVTLKKSVLDQKLIKISDIHPGDIIECKVKSLATKGVEVEVSKNIRGFIPYLHLAEVTLTHPEQKFKPGDMLKCRVLEVNKKRSSLKLTHKKSLINSEYPVITSFSDAKPGQILEGFIFMVKDFGCLVKFFGNVKGLCPRQMLSTEYIQYPEKVYYEGQVVRCKVVTVNPEAKKMTVTFVLEGNIDRGRIRKEPPADFKVGKKVECKVVKKLDSGLDVEVVPSKTRAFLPKVHLSDSMEMCDALWEMYQPGDIIEPAIYWHMTKMPFLTCKPCLVSAAESEEGFITTFDSLVPGTMLPGAVKNVVPYGIFVEFANGLYGLVPNQYACDERVKEVEAFYPIGKTVVAKVMEVDKEKKRFLASLRMQDCYHGNTDIGLELTLDRLKEREWLLERLAQKDDKTGKVCQMKFGSVHKALIKQLADQGAICELENGVKAVAVTGNVSQKFVSVGENLDCVVLYVDPKHNCLEVSLDNKLVPYVMKRASRDIESVAKVGQLVESVIVLVKEDFVVVKLNAPHALGQLAYIPAKRHWNDVLEKHQCTIGQKNQVVIKRVDGAVIMASLKIHEDKQKLAEELLPKSPHKLQLGGIYEAKVKKLYQDQVYVDMAGTRGRVHVTEICDEVTDGSNIMQMVKPGQDVKVRVIGFKEALAKKKNKYLPISHPMLNMAIPECTMKPSVLAMKELPKNYTDINKLNIGDKVVGYIRNHIGKCLDMIVAPNIHGRVLPLNILNDIESLDQIKRLFKKGVCYNTIVNGVASRNLLDLSLCGSENCCGEISVGKEAKGFIIFKKKEMGLALKLKDNIIGSIDVTDLSDNYTNQPLDQFKEGHVLTARVIELDSEKKKAVLSLRPEVGNKKPVDKRITSLTDLSSGQIVRGFVVHVSCQDIFIRLGVDVQVKVKVNELTKKTPHSAKTLRNVFPLYDVVKVKFLGLDKNNKAQVCLLGNDNKKYEIPPEYFKDEHIKSKQSKKERKRSISNTSIDSETGTPKKTKLKNTETTAELDEDIKLEIDGLENMDADSSEIESVVDSLDSEARANAVKRAEKNWKNFKISIQVKDDSDDESVHEEREVMDTEEPLVKKEDLGSSDDGSVLWSDDNDIAKSGNVNVKLDNEDSDSDNDDAELDNDDAELDNEDVESDDDGAESDDDNAELDNDVAEVDNDDVESDSDNEADAGTSDRHKNVTLSVSIGEGDSGRKVNVESESEVEDSSCEGDSDAARKQKSKKTKNKLSKSTEDKLPVSLIKTQGKKEKKKRDRRGSQSASTDEESSDDERKLESQVASKSVVKPVLEVNDGFSWDTEFVLPQKGEITSDESEDENEKPVKKTKGQLRRERLEEEQKLYQSEMQRLDGDVRPETADDFDRLVLESPDSSLVWLRYMAFHLETTEIDKARAVAERALKTISFREEQEKLNVWVAYLNLENMYGTTESLRNVLVRASQQNDQVAVYLQMINIYVKSGKFEDGEQLFNSLVKKYNGDKDLWIKFGEFYFQQGRFESARKLLQRCLKSLEMKHHVNTIVKFAQMEFKYGEPERGKTMFENTLSTYPNRTDLWSVYIDMVTKQREFDLARSIFNRVISNKMSTKKMKFFFKKYVEFEERHGTEDNVADVKKKALEYVESKGFVDE